MSFWTISIIVFCCIPLAPAIFELEDEVTMEEAAIRCFQRKGNSFCHAIDAKSVFNATMVSCNRCMDLRIGSWMYCTFCNQKHTGNTNDDCIELKEHCICENGADNKNGPQARFRLTPTKYVLNQLRCKLAMTLAQRQSGVLGAPTYGKAVNTNYCYNHGATSINTWHNYKNFKQCP